MNQKGFISSVFAIIVTLVIAAGMGGYIYSQSLIPDASETIPASYPPDENPKISFPLPASSTPPRAVAPAAWKTYRNEEFGFQMNYPDDWTVIDNLENSSTATRMKNAYVGFNKKNASPYVQFSLSGDSNEHVLANVEGLKEFKLNVKDYKVDGEEALLIEVGDKAPTRPAIIVVVSKGENGYFFSVPYSPSPEDTVEAGAALLKMLATFKFLK